MTSGMLFPALATLAARLPMYVVWIVAIALAVSRWERHRTVSLLVLISVVVELVLSVVGILVAMALPTWMLREGMASSQVGTAMSVVGLVQSLISAVCWGLVIGAVFIDRRRGSSESAGRYPGCRRSQPSKRTSSCVYS